MPQLIYNLVSSIRRSTCVGSSMAYLNFRVVLFSVLLFKFSNSGFFIARYNLSEILSLRKTLFLQTSVLLNKPVSYQFQRKITVQNIKTQTPWEK